MRLIKKSELGFITLEEVNRISEEKILFKKSWEGELDLGELTIGHLLFNLKVSGNELYEADFKFLTINAIKNILRWLYISGDIELFRVVDKYSYILGLINETSKDFVLKKGSDTQKVLDHNIAKKIKDVIFNDSNEVFLRKQLDSIVEIILNDKKQYERPSREFYIRLLNEGFSWNFEWELKENWNLLELAPEVNLILDGKEANDLIETYQIFEESIKREDIQLEYMGAYNKVVDTLIEDIINHKEEIDNDSLDTTDNW